MRIEKTNFISNPKTSFGTVIFHKSLEKAPIELRLGLEDRKQFLQNISKNVLMSISYKKSLFPWQNGLIFKVKSPKKETSSIIHKIINKLEITFGHSVKTKVRNSQGASQIRKKAKDAVFTFLLDTTSSKNRSSIRRNRITSSDGLKG